MSQRLGGLAVLLTLAMGASAGAAHAQTAATAAIPAAATPPAAPPASDWHFNIDPYLWLAGVGGQVSDQQGRSASFQESAGDVLSHLNAAVMLVGNVEYHRFLLLADFDYSSLSGKSHDSSPIWGQIGVRSTSYIGTGAVGYRVLVAPPGWIDVLAGARAMSFDNTTVFTGAALPSITLHSGATWADPVVAVRGTLNLGHRFFVNAYTDVGGGIADDLTWQVYGGVGYAISRMFVAYLGYRYLSIRHAIGGVTYDLHEQGPLLSIGVRF